MTFASAAAEGGQARSELPDHFALVFPRVIDATIRSDWVRCPHAFFRRHVQGLTRPGISTHLHFGSCIATGLEAARREFFASADTSDALHAGCEAAIAAWGMFEPPDHPTRTEQAKTLGACLAALQAYFREWPLDEDPLTIHCVNGEPCVEWSAALPIPGTRHPTTGEPILYAGRFDMVGAQRLAPVALWGLDDKTTSTDPNSDHWRNQWRLRGQFTGYAWLTREFGLPLRGFHIRGIGVMKTDIKLGWTLAPRPDWMIDQWLRQLQDDVGQMVAQYEWHTGKLGFGPPPLEGGHPFRQAFADACSDFGGCTYLDLCASEHPESWLDEFIVARWDPLARSAVPSEARPPIHSEPKAL